MSEVLVEAAFSFLHAPSDLKRRRRRTARDASVNVDEAVAGCPCHGHQVLSLPALVPATMQALRHEPVPSKQEDEICFPTDYEGRHAASEEDPHDESAAIGVACSSRPRASSSSSLASSCSAASAPALAADEVTIVRAVDAPQTTLTPVQKQLPRWRQPGYVKVLALRWLDALD